MLVIYDTVSGIPDIIIVQVIVFVSITSLHLTCVPFLSVVAVKLKLVVSPEVLLTRAAVNLIPICCTGHMLHATVIYWYYLYVIQVHILVFRVI